MHAVSALDAFLQRLQDAFFGILFVIQKHDHAEGNAWPVIEAVVDHIQDLTFPISYPFFPWQQEVHWLASALEWASPEIFLEGTTGIFEGLLIALALTIANAVWAGWAFSQNSFPVIWPLKTLRIMLVLFATVLYIPALTIFVSFVADCHGDCTSSPKLIVNIITVIITVVFILIVLAVSATFFDPDPNESIESRAHSRVHVAYIACRTLLVVLHTTLRVYGDPTSPINQWMLAVACVATSVSLAWMSLWYMPYYSVRYSMLRTTLNFNFAAVSIANIYNLIRPGSDVGIIMLCFLIPASTSLSYLCFQARLRMIEEISTEDADALTLELKIRQILRKRTLLYRTSPKANLTLSNASPGDLEHDHSGPKAVDTAETRAKEEEQRTIKAVYEMYLKKMREDPRCPLLLLFIGAFQLLQLGNKSQCLNTYEKAAALPSLRFDEAFLIFRRKRLLQDEFEGGDAINVIAIGQNMRLAKKYERRAATAVLQFWAELRQKRPQLRRLQKHGRTITSAVSAAQEHFVALMQMSPASPNPYRMYGSFLIHVVNDRDAGQKLLDHADELEESRGGGDQQEQEGMGGEEVLQPDMLSEKSGLFTISGNHEDIGTITRVNKAALKMFHYRKSDILRKNISTIVPSPFAEVHDEVLRAYLDTGYAKVIDRPRQVFGLHSSGYLMMMSLLVKQMPEEGGRQSFLGICSPAPEKPNEDYTILDAEMTVLHFTRRITRLFGTLPEWRREPGAQMPKLWDWMPELDAQRLKECIGRGRIKCIVVPKQQERRDETVEIALTASEVTVRDKVCYICRLVATPVRSEPLPQRVEADEETGSAPPSRQCPFGQESRLRPSQDGVVNDSVLSLTTESVEAMPLSFSKHSLHAGSNSNANHATPETPSARFTRAPEARRVATKRDSEAQSSASGSRRGTSETTFLRSLIMLRNKTAEKRLRWLTGVMLVSLLLISALGVVANLVYTARYAATQDWLEQMRSDVGTCLHAANIADAARTLQLIRAVGENRTGVFEAASATEQLSGDVAALKTLLLEDREDQSPVVWELVTTITARISYVLAASLADPMVDGHIEFVRANAGSGLLTAFNSSAFASIYQLDDDRLWTNMALPIAAPFVYLLLLLAFAWPLYSLIEDYRDQFLKLFLDIPRDVVTGIYEEHMQRLREADEQAQDDEDSGAEFDAGRRLLIERSIISEALPGSDLLGESHVPSDLADDDNLRAGHPAFWKRLRDPHMLFPRGLLVFGVCILYFVSAGSVVSRFAVRAGVRGRQLFWAAQQPVLIRQIDTMTRDLYVAAAGLAASAVTAEQTAALLETLGNVHSALVYGSENLGIPADIVARDITYKNLLYETACAAGSPDDCTTFNSGILSQGLHAALDWYGQYAAMALASPIVDVPALERAVVVIRALDQLYLPIPVDYLVGAQTTAIDEDVQWFRVFHLVCTILFVCAMALAYLALFRPLVQRLAEDSNRTHFMIFMCPASVLGKLDVVRQWMTDAGHGTRSRGNNPTKAQYDDKPQEAQTEKKVAIAATFSDNEDVV
ncbi:hypothetical protein HDU87_005182 [Geranomyces variabilis]|uniref:TmcB/TmcC TPR repeats domain-containing protein n=1 Tax=Geranomyces variabilis TaxID=109894 RepID=A0AAD5TJT6_9FUNG|nr:hypothetical protein HDU87_005182 [Geranomyces variabilis]